MILPTIRASFGRQDAMHLVGLLAGDDDMLRAAAEQRLDAGGIDALLDDPRVRNALLTDRRAASPPELIFYVLVRHALLEGGIDDRVMADYVATLVVSFGRERRAYRPSEHSDDEYRYLVDIVLHRTRVGADEAFLLNLHLGNLSLWLSGLFPQYLQRRERLRGAPSVRYYEEMGTTGYRLAADSGQAVRFGLGDVFNDVADRFSRVRVALNRLSDGVLWPSGGDPVERLLREMEQRVRG
ncbi:MAG: hypothetical protein R3E98_14960 [Gemmatimonadota bacterium]